MDPGRDFGLPLLVISTDRSLYSGQLEDISGDIGNQQIVQRIGDGLEDFNRNIRAGFAFEFHPNFIFGTQGNGRFEDRGLVLEIIMGEEDGAVEADHGGGDAIVGI